jgi:hypothetical protein
MVALLRAAPAADAGGVNATYAAAEIGARIRWSKAPSDAFAPSPIAMTICL